MRRESRRSDLGSRVAGEEDSIGRVLNVGWLTTWNTQCGIAEYSRALVEALQQREDVKLTVLGSRNYDERSVGEHEHYVVPCFDVKMWNRDGHDELDVERILELDLDVLHVQYEHVLYDQTRLVELLRRFDGPKFATWHDNFLPDGFEWQLFDHAFTHREGVGPAGATVVPHVIRKLPPVVRTFGMGRNRDDVVRPICERHGWLFESLGTSEQPFGGQPWRPWRDLHDWLRGADVIVLWYGDDPVAGSSGAVRTAIATRRPVVVNDTNWFRELPQQSGSFYKLKDDPAVLETTLREILRADSMIERWSTDEIAAQHVDHYEDALALRASGRTDEPTQGRRRALRNIPMIGRVVRAISGLALRRSSEPARVQRPAAEVSLPTEESQNTDARHLHSEGRSIGELEQRAPELRTERER